jgi:uncharacterized membrane protein (UPF0127 family)
MINKLAVLVPTIIAASVVGVLGITFFPSGTKNSHSPEFPIGTVRIGNDTIKVEIAKSEAERQRWLMFRGEKLPINSAMMLVYDKPDLYAMWLLNIDYNLDLLWFNANGNIVYTVKDAQICKNVLDAANCTYKNTRPAKYVIAGTSGFIAKHNIDNGSRLSIVK